MKLETKYTRQSKSEEVASKAFGSEAKMETGRTPTTRGGGSTGYTGKGMTNVGDTKGKNVNIDQANPLRGQNG